MDTRKEWEENTSFVEMLGESSVNDLLEALMIDPQGAQTMLHHLIDCAWEARERAEFLEAEALENACIDIFSPYRKIPPAEVARRMGKPL